MQKCRILRKQRHRDFFRALLGISELREPSGPKYHRIHTTTTQNQKELKKEALAYSSHITASATRPSRPSAGSPPSPPVNRSAASAGLEARVAALHNSEGDILTA